MLKESPPKYVMLKNIDLYNIFVETYLYGVLEILIQTWHQEVSTSKLTWCIVYNLDMQYMWTICSYMQALLDLISLVKNYSKWHGKRCQKLLWHTYLHPYLHLERKFVTRNKVMPQWQYLHCAHVLLFNTLAWI